MAAAPPVPRIMVRNAATLTCEEMISSYVPMIEEESDCSSMSAISQASRCRTRSQGCVAR